jgi:hypothetical protein
MQATRNFVNTPLSHFTPPLQSRQPASTQTQKMTGIPQDHQNLLNRLSKLNEEERSIIESKTYKSNLSKDETARKINALNQERRLIFSLLNESKGVPLIMDGNSKVGIFPQQKSIFVNNRENLDQNRPHMNNLETKTIFVDNADRVKFKMQSHNPQHLNQPSHVSSQFITYNGDLRATKGDKFTSTNQAVFDASLVNGKNSNICQNSRFYQNLKNEIKCVEVTRNFSNEPKTIKKQNIISQSSTSFQYKPHGSLSKGNVNMPSVVAEQQFRQSRLSSSEIVRASSLNAYHSLRKSINKGVITNALEIKSSGVEKLNYTKSTTPRPIVESSNEKIVQTISKDLSFMNKRKNKRSNIVSTTLIFHENDAFCQSEEYKNASRLTEAHSSCKLDIPLSSSIVSSQQPLFNRNSLLENQKLTESIVYEDKPNIQYSANPNIANQPMKLSQSILISNIQNETNKKHPEVKYGRNIENSSLTNNQYRVNKTDFTKNMLRNNEVTRSHVTTVKMNGSTAQSNIIKTGQSYLARPVHPLTTTCLKSQNISYVKSFVPNSTLLRNRHDSMTRSFADNTSERFSLNGRSSIYQSRQDLNRTSLMGMKTSIEIPVVFESNGHTVQQINNKGSNSYMKSSSSFSQTPPYLYGSTFKNHDHQIFASIEQNESRIITNFGQKPMNVNMEIREIDELEFAQKSNMGSNKKNEAISIDEEKEKPICTQGSCKNGSEDFIVEEIVLNDRDEVDMEVDNCDKRDQTRKVLMNILIDK